MTAREYLIRAGISPDEAERYLAAGYVVVGADELRRVQGDDVLAATDWPRILPY